MNEPQFNLFLSAASAACALGAILNLFKLKKRGNTAFILSAAFLALGGVIWLVKMHASQNLIIASAVFLCALLAMDVILRSRQQDRPQ